MYLRFSENLLITLRRLKSLNKLNLEKYGFSLDLIVIEAIFLMFSYSAVLPSLKEYSEYVSFETSLISVKNANVPFISISFC